MRLYAALLTLGIIWGMSFLFIKVLLEDAGTWGVVFLRSTSGVLLLLVVILIQRSKIDWKSLPYKALFTVGLTNAALPWGLIVYSELTISSSLASIINATTPLWTSVLGVLLFSVALKRSQWVGIGIGFLGILVLMNIDLNQLFSGNMSGFITMLLGTLCYGFSSHFARKYLQGVGVLIISISTLLVGMAFSFIAMMITEPFKLAVFTNMYSILSIIGLGVFGSGIAYLLYYYMIQKGSAAFAANVTYLAPIFATFWGILLLNETVSAHSYAGLLLILLGVFLSTRKVSVKQKIATEVFE